MLRIILGLVAAICAIAVVGALARGLCIGSTTCSVEAFSSGAQPSLVRGETFLLPLNQGRGFLCPGIERPRLTFWGKHAGLLGDEERFIDVDVDPDGLLPPRWSENGEVKDECIRLQPPTRGSRTISIDACGTPVDIPAYDSLFTAPTSYAICNYGSGVSLFAFISGVSDYVGVTFPEVRAGYAILSQGSPRAPK